MVDDHACQQVAEWGLVRDDGTRRPVAEALGTAIRCLSGFTAARFSPLERRTTTWAAWPDNPAVYTPNWRDLPRPQDGPGRHAGRGRRNGGGSRLGRGYS